MAAGPTYSDGIDDYADATGLVERSRPRLPDVRFCPLRTPTPGLCAGTGSADSSASTRRSHEVTPYSALTGKTAYLVSLHPGKVTPIDTATAKADHPIPVQGRPSYVAIRT
jgi:hypothetical protein